MSLYFSFRKPCRYLAVLALMLSTPLWAAQYTASFKNTDINEFINVVGRNLGKTVIIDPGVRGKVNVRSYDELNEQQYYQFFLNVLQVHGYAVIEMDNSIIKVIKDKDAKTSATPVVDERNPGEGDEFVSRVVPVHNVSVKELAPLLRQINDNAGGGVVVPYNPSNVIMITGRAATVNRLVDIVKRVDTAGDQDVEIIDLQYASAAEIVRIVQSLNRAQGNKGGADFLEPKVVADERTNSVIITGDPRARARVVKLVQRLDAELQTSGNTKVFYLKYAKAADLVKVLKGVSESIAAEENGVSNKKSSSKRRDISIDAHEENNALVITAQPDMMQSLETVIRQLDIRRAQVHIEAIIVEMAEGDDANLGIQYFHEDAGALQWTNGGVGVAGIWAGMQELNKEGTTRFYDEDGNITREVENEVDYDSVANLLGGINGMLLGVVKQDWAAVIQAIQSDSNSNVLSTPSITTLDNQEAFFVVGTEVPILTGSTSSSNNTNPFQTVERQEVGVKLKVTPQINEGNAVRLTLEQEVSSVGGTTAIDITINKRELKTTVMVEDGNTIVLGGLIDEDTQESVSKVPLLGDIPLLGKLFTSTSSKVSKRNLMVFIRPTIVRDDAVMTEVSHRKYNFIRAKQLKARDDEVPLTNSRSPLLPKWDNPLTLPPSFEEHLQQLEKADAERD